MTELKQDITDVQKVSQKLNEITALKTREVAVPTLKAGEGDVCHIPAKLDFNNPIESVYHYLNNS